VAASSRQAWKQAIFTLHSEPPIQFFCAVCGQSLNADAHFGGSVIACPACDRSVPVPGRIPWPDEGPKWHPAFSPEILSVEITFVCPGCQRALIADARWGGEAFICPKCETTSEVPNWTRAKIRPPDMAPPAVSSAPALTPEEIAFLSDGPGEITPVISG
jgi:predicted RNA-binding Zn-ribbon protein involved in translation (DUF1610 family)